MQRDGIAWDSRVPGRLQKHDRFGLFTHVTQRPEAPTYLLCVIASSRPGPLAAGRLRAFISRAFETSIDRFMRSYFVVLVWPRYWPERSLLGGRSYIVGLQIHVQRCLS